MPALKYSDEFKAQVLREVIEKEQTIASVASTYGLVKGSGVRRKTERRGDCVGTPHVIGDSGRLSTPNHRRAAPFGADSQGCEGEYRRLRVPQASLFFRH